MLGGRLVASGLDPGSSKHIYLPAQVWGKSRERPGRGSVQREPLSTRESPRSHTHLPSFLSLEALEWPCFLRKKPQPYVIPFTKCTHTLHNALYTHCVRGKKTFINICYMCTHECLWGQTSEPGHIHTSLVHHKTHPQKPRVLFRNLKHSRP